PLERTDRPAGGRGYSASSGPEEGGTILPLRRLALAGALVAATLAAAAPAGASTHAFSNTPLISTWSPPPGLTTQPHANSTGNSEPAIAFGPDGTMAVDGLGWLPFQVDLWKGRF